MSAARRGFVLPVVLVVIGLLALTMAGFMFFVRAEVAGAQAQRDAQQADLAARSGLQQVIVTLRDAGSDSSVWFDDPNTFHHALVWAESYDRENDPLQERRSRKELLDDEYVVPAWRFSVVAADLDQDPGSPIPSMRFGLTPEAGKLNINSADEEEVRRLFEAVLIDLDLQNWEELLEAFLDWRDPDDEMRPAGAESDYYTALVPGYYAKNGNLDTIDELLLVKGFSSAVLWGEDTNRNGILDPNEDDGDASFPFYDNADGILNHGLAPYLTVWSRETAESSSGGEGGEEGEGEQSEEESAEESEGAEAESEQGSQSETGSENQGTEVAGRINVNTAPARVLMALEGLSEADAEQIIALRREQTSEALQSTEWLTASGALDPVTYDAVKDRLTTNAYQFHVEVLGYADHLKLFRRYEWIVEVRGPVVQVVYHRDLTSLGFAWPIDDEQIVTQGE